MLDVTYQSTNADKASKFRVMPLGLVQRGPRMYPACRFEGYENNRSLELHRMKASTATKFWFEQPSDFDLRQRDDDMGFSNGTPRLIRLRFQLDKLNGRHTFECLLSADRTPDE